MKRSHKSTARRSANRFYSGAKISEYQFKRVLWSFVLDAPVAEAARRIDLSANSIQAIYAKLRVFFTAIGLFLDIYQGGDPRDGTPQGEDMEGFEYRLIPFHIKRIKAKRRAEPTMLGSVDHHWNESFWRFHFSILQDARPSQTDAIHRMMYAHLLAHIRLCGPVGQTPRRNDEGRRLARRQLVQRLLWLERNAPAFSDLRSRAGLKEIREQPFE